MWTISLRKEQTKKLTKLLNNFNLKDKLLIY